LDLDNELSLAEALLEAEVLQRKPLDLSVRLWYRFAARFPGTKAIHPFCVANLPVS
jgi:hypothetical protein